MHNKPPSNLPSGCIILWFGEADNIPQGYLICNGEDNTPDLRDCFIIGAGKSYKFKANGGNETHNHTAQTTLKILDTKHSHKLPNKWYANMAEKGGAVSIVDRNLTSQPWQTEENSHNHDTKDVETSIMHSSTLPPYYALFYIMKI